MRREWLRGLLVFALLMIGFALKGLLIAPPPLPAHAEPTEFNAPRAIARLGRILGDQRAHSVDTAADDAVRDRLIAELRALGLQPEVREAMDCSGFPRLRVVSCARVRNVIATIPGRSAGKHLLINAHYDSTPTGPGASDDGLGVATMLEVAALFRQSPPPRPVTLLFNEGEEYGLNGADSFVRRDPLAKDVNSLINIDTRGVSGPALMFETSSPNGAAIAAYSAGTRHPYANSISTDFAKLIPNSTDVVKFAPRGWTLLNYGIIGNETRYHSPGDNIAALDRASVAQVGSEVWAAAALCPPCPIPHAPARGAWSSPTLRAGSSSGSRSASRQPSLALLLMVVTVPGVAQKGARTAPAARGGHAVRRDIVAGLVTLVAGLFRAGDFWRAYPLVAYLAVYAVLLAAMAAIWSLGGEGLSRERMRAAAWLLILIFAAALSAALPGATIFFLIAPALGLVGIALADRSPQPRHCSRSCDRRSVPDARPASRFGRNAADRRAVVGRCPACRGRGLARDHRMSIRTRLRPALLVLAVAAVGLWIAALIIPRASAERPLAFTIDYFRDVQHTAQAGAWRTSRRPCPPDFPGRWHKGVLPYNRLPRWIAAAPLLATPVPSARLIADQPDGAGRRVRLELSRGGADALAIGFPGEGQAPRGGTARPVAIPPKGEPDKAILRCTGRSCDGLVIEPVLADREPIVAELFSTQFGFRRKAGRWRPRDRPMRFPQYSPDQAITLTRIRL